MAGTFHLVRVDPDAAGVQVDEDAPGDGGVEPTVTIDPDAFDGVVTLVAPRPVDPGDHGARRDDGPGEPPGTVIATVLRDDVPAPTGMRDMRPPADRVRDCGG